MKLYTFHLLHRFSINTPWAVAETLKLPALEDGSSPREQAIRAWPKADPTHNQIVEVLS